MTTCWVDLRRPNLFTEADFVFWRRIHWAVEEMGDKITKNSAYHLIEECLVSNQEYGGGGFSYKFWFQNTEDRSTFINSLSQIAGPFVAQQLEISR